MIKNDSDSHCNPPYGARHYNQRLISLTVHRSASRGGDDETPTKATATITYRRPSSGGGTAYGRRAEHDALLVRIRDCTRSQDRQGLVYPSRRTRRLDTGRGQAGRDSDTGTVSGRPMKSAYPSHSLATNWGYALRSNDTRLGIEPPYLARGTGTTPVVSSSLNNEGVHTFCQEAHQGGNAAARVRRT